jgi:N-acetylmuramic acid 6-phosphate (MurNAc-6-P) etherase
MTNTSTDEKMKPSEYWLDGIRTLFLSSLVLLLLVSPFAPAQQQETVPVAETNLLKLLQITLSPESVDYVQNKTQFQLHTLLTEQRHPKTWTLSERIQKDIPGGLRLLFSVDEDIVERLEALSQDPKIMDGMANEIQAALLAGNRIYIYGCGATGRLAKQMESSLWRPFWKVVKNAEKIWAKIKPYLADPIEDQLSGEMTGGDRALISSLEGFEDLQLLGRLQLQDRKIKKGDVVICVTEGGETSSVIGTILAALDEWKGTESYDPQEAKKKLYFVYNNPDSKLLPFDRSRKVLEEPGITKINLTTGPQAITGSTRMQATTIETLVIGNVLEVALDRTLRKFLTNKEMARLGFPRELRLQDKLKSFSSILEEVKKNIPAITRFTELEAATYRTGNFSTYFAQRGLITVFIDCTERSPTFRLYPLDTVREPKRKCWIQVWTEASDPKAAWQAFLGRPFRGLAEEFYKKHFEAEVDDPYLKAAALESLKKAGNNQQFLYDFSFSEFNIKNRGPKKGDLGVLACLSPEEDELKMEDSYFWKFIDLFAKSEANVVLILVSNKSANGTMKLIQDISNFMKDKKSSFEAIQLEVPSQDDSFGLNQQIALKVLLNAHSSAVMTHLGKVVGNTMVNVSPSNLKLIGRATYLIQSHVNDVLSHPNWVKLYGLKKTISYGEANAVLFDSIALLKEKQKEAGQTAEVALSIIRILESLRLKRGVSPGEALDIVQKTGLSQYLATIAQNTR